jgi:UDP-N-acetylglucosamine 2-epimerase (non-hydrolysing)
MSRSRLALVKPNAQRPQRRWIASSGGASPYRLVHVIGAVDDVCRIAPVVAALNQAGTFEHIAVDATAGPEAARALDELGVPVLTHALDVGGRSAPRRLGALLEGFDALHAAGAPNAAIVYADDDASVACALAAARAGVPLVQVEPRGGTDAMLLNRLADLVLATDEGHEERLVRRHVPRHRIRVVGDPLVEVFRRHASRSAALEACRRHGVQPGGYALVAVEGSLPPSLAALKSRLPLLVALGREADARALAPQLEDGRTRVVVPAGLAVRLCLERAAGAILTDSRRAADRAEALAVPYRLVTDWTAELGALRPRRRGVGLGANSLRDSGAPARLADAIIASFARVVAI